MSADLAPVPSATVTAATGGHRQATASRLQLALGGYSCAGGKTENQDAFAAHVPQGYLLTSKGAVVALADGVSSAEQAAQAAQLSVTQFISDYYQTADTLTTPASAARVLSALNLWLYGQGSTLTRAPQQWLTTFSALIAKSATGYIFHVGDTRISQYRQQQLRPLTRDHNQHQGGQRRILTRALGADSHLEVDMQRIDLQAGDIYLLSSDGVHEFLSNKALSRLLAQLPDQPSQHDLEHCSETIINEALAAGSDDNLSCLLLFIAAIPNLTPDEIAQQLMSKAIPPALKPGMRLDGYEVLRTLHASTRSHLYLVKHPEHEQPLVLKAPSPNFADDAIYLQGFIREAWLAERLQHPQIMRIQPAQQQSRFLYHLCEYLDGQTLSSWMQEHGKPPLSEVQSIITQLVSALRALQRLSLVHRDIKPDNIMIDRFGQIKLLDYGTVWSAALDEQQDVLPEQVPQGSLNYIAPETLLTMHTSHQSDLFSVAVLCYELLTGELPYKPMRRAECPYKHYQQWQYRPLRQFRPDLPLWLDLALQHGCQADPAQRYRAYSEFLHDLKQPNPDALESYRQQPLLTRDPVRFWQGLALLQLLLIILLLLH